MTKLHEEFLEGFPAQLLTRLSGREKIMGEVTVLIQPHKKHQVDPEG
jgi:16S rRNA C1402 (ribose-2'-O) methylase RsmI